MIESKAKWNVLQEKDNESFVRSEYLPIHSEITYRLLQQRGIESEEEMIQFLNPSINDLTDPEELPMILKAKKRMEEAIEKGEKILIFGDYDADGICATTLMLKVLKELGAECDYYIPDRFQEGYGLNEEAIKRAYDHNFQVIVTVDTGIASIHEAELAKNLEIDLIITDHHEVQEELPDAYAIVNPKCSDDIFQELAGVGVAFKLAECLLGYFPDHLLDLVAIGTVADLVPLIQDNRIFVYYGLKKLQNTSNFGIQALKKLCRLTREVTEDDIGFLIGPRLNSVGRMQHAHLAVELLMADEKEKAQYIAQEIEQINGERQRVVKQIVQEAETIAHQKEEENIIIVAKEDWHEGVLGIVAARLVKKFDKPAIVFAIDKEQSLLKGSARSIKSFNLFESCMQVRDLFIHFGGHSQAAGMTLPLENLSTLEEKMNEIIAEQFKDEEMKQIIDIDFHLDICDLTEELYKDLAKLAPFGMGNPKPIFKVTDRPVEIRQLGQAKDHLKFQFRRENKIVEGIGFGFGKFYPYISPQVQISIVGEFGMNEWNGYRTPQIILKDFAVRTWQLFDYRGKHSFPLEEYLSFYTSHLILSTERVDDANSMEGMQVIDYFAQQETLKSIDALFIFDLPPTLSHLERIVLRTKPKNIYLCMHIEESNYLQTFPTRKDFKWLYALLYRHQTIDLTRDLKYIAELKQLSKQTLMFMIDVFLELGFVTKKDQMLLIQKNPTKKDLEQSERYQKMKNDRLVEQTLYFSTYTSVRKWFEKFYVNVHTPSKEEINNGL